MLLALLAIVFFTTVALVSNRSMWSQAASLDNAAKVIQATQLAHSRLDQIDARLFSKQLAFASIKTTYNTTQNVVLTHPGYKFTVTYLTVDCDSLGTPVTPANNLFVKVSVSVAASGGMRYPVKITRLYTKTNLNI